ncbi:AzlD domain-containing protein [Streptomyces sp. NPDC008150]|uniref:AzlD domain-containing protein n=1 Tax=Streptomyces sp. NPDC008150 TaxID=3364816 RepID=UPI0036E21EEE
MNATVVAVLALAVGTYAFRLAGPVLDGRVEIPPRVRSLLSTGAVVLLVALLATGALTEGHGFAGWARPAGVLVGAVLALRRAPFAVVVLAAVAVTAGLRAAGAG